MKVRDILSIIDFPVKFEALASSPIGDIEIRKGYNDIMSVPVEFYDLEIERIRISSCAISMTIIVK